MRDNAFRNTSCRHCGAKLEYPEESEGQSNPCLVCGKDVLLLRKAKGGTERTAMRQLVSKGSVSPIWFEKSLSKTHTSASQIISRVIALLLFATFLCAAIVSVMHAGDISMVWISLLTLCPFVGLLFAAYGFGGGAIIADKKANASSATQINDYGSTTPAKQRHPVLVTICILLFGFWGLSAWRQSTPEGKAESKQDDAYSAAKTFATRMFPGAKSFSSRDESTVVVTGGVLYSVTLVVDGVNSFNAPRRF